MSDDELESFEITDYDLDNEFNTNRPRRKLSKKQQMLGIWASDSDEEEVESHRPSFKVYNRGPKNYTAPVSFIAGGIQQAGKPKEEEKKNQSDYDNEEEQEEEEEEEEEEGEDEERSRKIVRNSSSDSENEGPRNIRGRHKTFSLHNDGDIAGLRRKKTPFNPALMESGVGNWEVHTKGIGARLLLKMGFEPGKGLGKKLQGISAPVEAHIRRGRGAIGAYGPEKMSKAPEKKKEETNEDTKEPKVKVQQWRKSDAAAKKKVKYCYRSVDQVIEDGKLRTNRTSGVNSEISKVKVIDMTGPEQRILSGYHAIAGQQRPSETTVIPDKKFKSNFSLPELQHNLNLLVDMCEQEIIQNDKRSRTLSDRLIALESEKTNILKVISQQGKMMDTLENVLLTVDKLINKSNEMTLKETAEAFQDLQEHYYEEYKIYELGELASSLVGPKVKDSLISWNPLIQPQQPLEIFKLWKGILECGKATLQTNSLHPYDHLVWNAWMPSIRGAVQEWPCRKPDPLIDLIELWLPYLPGWILENILDLLVLPKLTLEVEEWNPLTDTVPIHTWIHPWLPLLRNRLDTQIYPIIRRKLGSALGGWHAADRSARLMLEPWAQVFSKGDLEAFLIKNIVPKLQIALSELIIHPLQQNLEQWHCVYEWRELLPVHIMAGLLDKFFFPKWLQTLAFWLNHSPNYDQVTNWYLGWKGLLNEKLLAEPVIKDHFNKALEMMNRAAVAIPQGLQPGALEQVSYLTSLERSQPSITQIPSNVQPRLENLVDSMKYSAHSNSVLPYKDLVQKKCEERGILFMPIANKYREAKQVYKIGQLQAYLDGNSILVCHGSNWIPTSLNALLDMCDM